MPTMTDDRMIDMKPMRADFYGHHGEIMAKRDYVNYLLAGLFPQDAADRVGITLSQVNYWRKKDDVFDEQCDIALAQLRDSYLPQIEANILRHALEPTKDGAKMALNVAERLAPDVWGKKKPGETHDSLTSKHLSDWMDDPAIIDIEPKGQASDGDDD